MLVVSVRLPGWYPFFLEFIIVYSRFPQNLVPHKFFQKLLILHLVINRNNLGIFSHFTFFNLWHSIHQSVCLKVDLLLRCFFKNRNRNPWFIRIISTFKLFYKFVKRNQSPTNLSPSDLLKIIVFAYTTYIEVFLDLLVKKGTNWSV